MKNMNVMLIKVTQFWKKFWSISVTKVYFCSLNFLMWTGSFLSKLNMHQYSLRRVVK